MQNVTPVCAVRNSQWVEVAVTSAWGGAGAVFSNTTDSTSLTLRNVGSFPFEYRVNSGAWTRLELRNSIDLNISLASATVRLRKSEFGGDALARFEIESLTGEFATVDEQPLDLGGSGGPGGPVAFTDLTDVPSSFVGKAGQALAVNSAEDALSMVHRAAPYGFSSVSAVASWAMPAAAFGLAYMNYFDVSGGGATLAITLPDAADVLAACPWIAEAPGLTDGDVVGVTLRVMNRNNIGTGAITFVNGDGVAFMGKDVAEKTWNDYFVNVIYNDPETPLTFEVYDAGSGTL